MNTEGLRKLEYEKVRERLMTYAMSYLGRQYIEEMHPVTDMRKIEHWQHEVEEALMMIQHGASVPIPALEGMDRILGMLGKGYLLQASEIAGVGQLLETVGQMKRFFQKRELIAPNVSSYSRSLDELPGLRSEIEACIRHGQVTNEASPELTKVRKKIAVLEERLKKKLDSVLNKYRSYLQDSVVSTRNERYVIPVKKEFKKMVPGSVLDESSSGHTVFVEPADVASLQQEILGYRWDEDREISKVLSYLTGLIEERQASIQLNLEVIGHCDYLFARAKFARDIGGRAVHLNREGIIRIVGGRHPLLTGSKVPPDFSIGESYRALIITGPNTGGKTVCLKTVGLLTVLVQSGLLVPVEEGSTFSVYNDVLADIGDGQSIEQSLSTFSAHVTNVIEILKLAGEKTLILLDELATGTDPGEGIGLSIAVLEELYRKGATILATTHYNEIKRFAERAEGFQNARMEFDVDTLEPLYRLRIGEAGHSYAFVIAQKLGIPERIIERSRQITYGEVRHTAQVPMDAALGGEVSERKHQVLTNTGASVSADNTVAEQGNEDHDSEKRKQFQLGDRVWIHPMKKSGIVYALADHRGNVGVIVQKKKMTFNMKRLALYLTRDELYPEDYDLDIVLESKDVRKKRKTMKRKHVPGLTIEHPAE